MRGLGRNLFLGRSAKPSHLWSQKITKYSLFVSSAENGSSGIGNGNNNNNHNNNNKGVYQHNGHFFSTTTTSSNTNRSKKEQESEDTGGSIKLHEYETDRVGQTSQTNPGELPLTELVRDFVRPSVLFEQLKEFGHEFYCGVPDSLLKDFCAYVTDHVPNTRHIITPNEGNAISVGVGYHMATGKIPIIYLQNSGLGNAVNPLLSLSDRKVCQVPLLLMVGWRGEPGRKDEPQHMVQGKATTALLADMGIPFEILPDYEEGTIETIRSAHLHFQQRGSPYCLLVRKRTFTPYKLQNTATNNYPLNRQAALQLVLENTSPWDAVVATTGFTSRELYELRLKEKALLAAEDPNHPELSECKDLLMVGSMGHASSIALGIAVNKPSRNIICLDGDGAMLMHMGILSTIGAIKPRNLRHILLNNAAHDSVGQQPTTAYSTNLPEVAKACGYTWSKSVSEAEDIKVAMKQMAATDGPTFLEIRVRPGAKKDLGRPKESPLHNKKAFMEFLNK